MTCFHQVHKKCYTYQTIITIDGTNLCLSDNGANRGFTSHKNCLHWCSVLNNGCVHIWGGGPEMFLKPVLKGSSKFPNVLLFTTYLGTFKPVDYPTLWVIWSLSFRPPEGFDGIVSLKWNCTPTLLHTFLKPLLGPLA